MEKTWRKIIASTREYVKPVTYPLPLLAHSRGRNDFNRACFKIDVAGLPEEPCIYVMRHKASDILRVGVAGKGFCDRVVRGYNRPYTATHPTMTRDLIFYHWEYWAGGAHLTNAFVMFGLSRAMRKGELAVEIYTFPSADLFTWERRMLDAYMKAFGVRPELNRGNN